MWYTIILLSIALAVSVAFWVRADRMAGHYRREYEAEHDRNFTLSSSLYDEREQVEEIESRFVDYVGRNLKNKSDLTTTRRQLAAARGQITRLRRKYGEIE